MRKITITKELFSFEELSEKAKQKALDECREVDFYQGSEIINSIKKGCEMFGTSLVDYDIWWGENGRTSWKWDKDIGEELLEISGLRLMKWITNNLSSFIWQRKPYGEYKERNGKWCYARRSNIKYTESCCPFTGICHDEDFLHPVREFLKHPCDSVTLEDLIESCVESCISSGHGEYEHIMSDEYTEERILEMEREFLEDGTLH